MGVARMSVSGYVPTNSMTDKENLVDKMPKLFSSTAKDRVDFSRPASATTNQRFSRPPSSSMNGTVQQKRRGLASRPTTASSTNQTRSTAFSGGKLIERNGEKFVVTQKQKATGYKKFPKQGTTSYLTPQSASFVDHS